MAFCEFWCGSGGSNLNAGSINGGGDPDGGSYPFTYAGGTFVRSTGVYTVASGNPLSDGVAVGDYVSIYTTAGATVANCVARVTARDATTITISGSPVLAVGAVANVSESAGAATAIVGGRWAGPSGTVPFPFGSVLGTGVDTSSNTPRVSFLPSGQGSGGTANFYLPTSAMTHNVAGPCQFEGATSAPGDGGKATIDGGTASTFAVLTIGSSAEKTQLVNFVFTNDYASGSNQYLVLVYPNMLISKCVFHDCRGIGLYLSAGSIVVRECEAYNCNKANQTNFSAFYCDSGVAMFERCNAHDNDTGTNCHGWKLATTLALSLVECIADSNGGFGVIAGSENLQVLRCDFYANIGGGLQLYKTDRMTVLVESCNFVKNTGVGIDAAGTTGDRNGLVSNCGFGNGTQANAGGKVSGLKSIVESGSVDYAANVTPWVDPANGDFRINRATAIGTGRGTFTQNALTAWATSTAYAKGDRRSVSGTAYVCLVAHTSGTFATDLASGYWSGDSQPVIGACQVADYPAVAEVYPGTTGASYANGAYVGVLRASNIHSGAGAPGIDLAVGDLADGKVVDDVTGTLVGGGGVIVIDD